MEANWKLFGRTHATEYELARRRTFLKIDLDQLTKNVNILRKLCSDQTGKLIFTFVTFYLVSTKLIGENASWVEGKKRFWGKSIIERNYRKEIQNHSLI